MAPCPTTTASPGRSSRPWPRARRPMPRTGASRSRSPWSRAIRRSAPDMDLDITGDEGGAVTGPATGVELTRRRSAELFVTFRDETATQASREGARDALVHLHLPLVEHCARRFRNRGEPFEDLVQVGTIGLIKSIDRFDSDRGVEFSTYATPTIIGEIKRYFRDKGWAIRVPRRLQEMRISIGGVTGELSQQLGRSPTPQEIADRLEVSLEEVL